MSERWSPDEVRRHVKDFAVAHGYTKTKGGLAVGLQVTRYAREEVDAFPIEPRGLLTPRGGQVKLLSRDNLERILGEYGITRILSKEGARTNRGSIDHTQGYVRFLNKAAKDGKLAKEDLEHAEAAWVELVREFFAGRPFEVNLDATMGLSAFVREVLDLAKKRDKEGAGLRYAGAVLQHLVGAKLGLVLDEQIDHHSFSTSDDQGGRQGDFEVGDAAIHVTTAPTEAVIRRCEVNLRANSRPVIVTIAERVSFTRTLATDAGILDRVDILDAEQFISTNIYELTGFKRERRDDAIRDLLEGYNDIIDLVETDPSMKIVAK